MPEKIIAGTEFSGKFERFRIGVQVGDWLWVGAGRVCFQYGGQQAQGPRCRGLGGFT